MSTAHPKSMFRIRSRHLVTQVAALAVLLAVLGAPTADVAAKAPPLATTVLEVSAFAAPDYDAAVVAVLPAGAEVELTGNAAPGFLGVLYGGQEVFVPAQFLTLGTRRGIDTAMTVEDAPLLDAPLRDGQVRLTIPDGQTVILTGATVDGYDAASYEGTGGWIDRRSLAR